MPFSVRIPAALFGLLSVLGGTVLPSPALSAPDANLVAPLADAKNWRLQVAGKMRATLVRDGNVDVITTTAVDDVPYHGLFQYFGPALEEGQLYTLRFRAKADARRTLPVYALIAGGDNHGIGLRQAPILGTEWRTFEYTFLVAGRGDAKIFCPQFTVGNAVGTTYLSGVSLTQAAPGTAVTPPPATPFWFLVNVAPGKATLANDGDAKTVTITSAGTEDWHVQLDYVTGGLQDGKPYVVRFRARADAPRDMMLSGQINSGDYHGIVTEQYVALGTDWKPFLFTLTPHDAAGHDVFFPQFLLGKKAGTVWLDGITAQPETPDPVADPAAYAPKAGELRAEGTIQAAGFGPDGFTLLVSRLVRPDGTVTPLSPARAKPVRLTADTAFRSLQDGSQLYLATLKPGDAVSIIGPDLGVGKPLPARLMLR